MCRRAACPALEVPASGRAQGQEVAAGAVREAAATAREAAAVMAAVGVGARRRRSEE